MHAFGLRKGDGSPGENPHRYSENMQTQKGVIYISENFSPTVLQDNMMMMTLCPKGQSHLLLRYRNVFWPLFNTILYLRNWSEAFDCLWTDNELLTLILSSHLQLVQIELIFWAAGLHPCFRSITVLADIELQVAPCDQAVHHLLVLYEDGHGWKLQGCDAHNFSLSYYRGKKKTEHSGPCCLDICRIFTTVK